MLIRSLFLTLSLLLAQAAQALTADEARGIAIGETEARIEALNKAITTADDKTAAFLQALSEDAVKFAGDKVFVMRDDKGFDPVTGAELPVPAEAEDVINNNMMRGEIEAAQAGLKLFSKDEKLRREGIKVLQGESDESRLPMIEKALAAETNPQLKEQLGLIRSAVLLNSSDKAKRLAAAAALARKWPGQHQDPAAGATEGRNRSGRQGHPGGHPAHGREVRWPWATGSGRCSAASAWARSCCWWRWAWRSPTG